MTPSGAMVFAMRVMLMAMVAHVGAAELPKRLCVPSIFGDHMVIQAGRPCRVWGMAQPGELVTVLLGGHQAQCAADATGCWQVELAPFRAGEGMELRISTVAESVVCTDVAAGEVWLGSGQSNMEQGPGNTFGFSHPDVVAANDRGIRLFKVQRHAATGPQETIVGRWEVCSPSSVRAFSPVLYYFGRELRRRDGGTVVGLVQSAWGGTPLDTWLPRDYFVADAKLSQWVSKVRAEQAKAHVAWEAWRKIAPRDVRWDGAVDWAQAGFDDSRWSETTLPARWVDRKLHAGAVWFRRALEVPSGVAGKELQLALGSFGGDFEVYLDGKRIGHGNVDIESNRDLTADRQFTVAGDDVRAGRCLLAIRLFAASSRHGQLGNWTMSARSEAGELKWGGPWRMNVESSLPDAPPAPSYWPAPDDPQAMFTLFDGMIHPLTRYVLRGVVWWQGGSGGANYDTHFPALIRGWRQAWTNPEMPFLFVQLPAYSEVEAFHGRVSPWQREGQASGLCEPGTAMAVTLDLGDGDMHPAVECKRAIATRLANAADEVVYGRKGDAWRSPMLANARIEGDTYHLTLQPAVTIVDHDGPPVKDMMVAGEDRVFHPAEVTIVANTLRVRSDAVPHPVAVRYAWLANPVAELRTEQGIPVAPFRTDRWPWSPAATGVRGGP